ncbi:restriction endonuclease subunit S [Comamonas sp. 26]|uniref:restriction endonuclease subunit S n=1 Tax=Comamonas sp. 26 TaxID=2035201 RepID=UPI000C1A1A7C|nr:restriction endonuclease subunit S [Comamonas sp. 26]PIG00369.1 type I restriction enzyme S subunit [Comamonas sp. 26]
MRAGKQGYKETSVGWIPIDWVATTLGNEVATIIGGGTPSKEVAEYWGGDIPWASVKDFVGSRLNKTQDRITRQAIKASATNLIPAGTLITPTRMALGRVAVFDCEVAINQDLKAIFPKSSLLKEFLFYWFQANADRIEAAGTGSTVKGIRLETLREFWLALPSLPEQQKIAAILTAVDDKLDVIARQIEVTQTLKQGLMQTLFSRGVGTQDADGRWVPHADFKDSELGVTPAGWKVGVIGNYVSALRSGVSVNAEDRTHQEGEVGVLKVSGVLNGQFRPNEHKTVLSEELSRVAEPVKQGRIIISRANTPALVGESAYVDSSRPDLFLPDKLWQTQASDTPHSVKWLAYYLQSPSVRQEISKAATGTSGSMKNIAKPAFLGIPMPLIPLPEQEKMADILTAVTSKLTALVGKQAHFQALKRGLMQKLLTGEWRVSVDASATGA